MAVPTITALSPTGGHTGGRTIVEIDGTNFRLPTAQVAVDGIVPVAPASVAVHFGATAALEVRVVSATLLYVITPIHDAGAVDVVVQNIADNGVPIGGEAATAALGYTFALPDLTAESDLARCIRTLLQELKRQIHPNVSWPASTDYDDTTGDNLSITKIASFPGLVVASVDINENRFYSINEGPELPTPDGLGFVRKSVPVTVDIVATLVGLSDNSVELLNLMASTKRFFRKNIYLEMARDPADATKGTVKYEMDWNDSPDVKVSTTANESNVRHFAGTITVRGFDIEDMAGVQGGGPGEVSGNPHEATVDVGKTADTVVLEPTAPEEIS